MVKKFTNDQRVRLTKAMIRSAFLELLRTRPIRTITVKELCQNAGVNRSTFYAHYTDVYDLCRQLEDELYCELVNALEPLLREPFAPAKVTERMFSCLKQNSDLCAATLGPYGDKEFLLKLVSVGRDMCIEGYTKYYPNASNRQVRQFYAFVSSGCIGLLRMWLAEGMLTPAEDMAAVAESIILHGIGYLENPQQH